MAFEAAVQTCSSAITSQQVRGGSAVWALLRRGMLLRHGSSLAILPGDSHRHNRPVMAPAWLANEDKIAASCKDLQRACDLAPYDSKRWRELGVSFWESGRLQSALRAAETADALTPGHADTLTLLGRCRAAMAAHAGARAAFGAAFLSLYCNGAGPSNSSASFRASIGFEAP